MFSKKITSILVISFFIIGCSPNNEQSTASNNSYETTKKMITDILKSDEGKAAIIEVIEDDSTQQLYVIHDDLVKTAIEETLTSDEGKEFWGKMFSDHEFVKAFSEAMISQQEDVFKRLMADSSYQEKLLELFSNPEFSQQIQEQLKSQKFKGHLEASIQETLEAPLFQANVAEIVIQHAKKIVNEDSGSEEDQQSGEGESNGQSEE